jgi:hypothetical protein
LAYILADPSSTLNYSFDWATAWLPSGVGGSPTDTIASRQWIISPLNGTSPETPTLTGDTTDIVFVEGLLPGRVYRLVEEVLTAAGVRDQRSIVLRCDET